MKSGVFTGWSGGVESGKVAYGIWEGVAPEEEVEPPASDEQQRLHRLQPAEEPERSQYHEDAGAGTHRTHV